MKLERFRRASLVSQERHPDDWSVPASNSPCTKQCKRGTAQGNVETTGCTSYALPSLLVSGIECHSILGLVQYTT